MTKRFTSLSNIQKIGGAKFAHFERVGSFK
jgi:hypothetical protein